MHHELGSANRPLVISLKRNRKIVRPVDHILQAQVAVQVRKLHHKKSKTTSMPKLLKHKLRLCSCPKAKGPHKVTTLVILLLKMRMEINVAIILMVAHIILHYSKSLD